MLVLVVMQLGLAFKCKVFVAKNGTDDATEMVPMDGDPVHRERANVWRGKRQAGV